MKLIMKSIILASIATIFSCRGERWDDDLTLPKQGYEGNQLRIDGYYFNESDGRTQVFFYFRDGVVLDAGAVLNSNISFAEQEFMNGIYYNHAINYKYKWGRFIINGTTIKAELWKPNTGPWEAYTSEGIVLNDTTFKMTKTWRSCKPKKVREYEEIYHFKKLAPKPDSTNRYTN